MLRGTQDVAASNAVKSNSKAAPAEQAAPLPGILDRERLMERLQMQIERQKAQFALEGRVWADTVGPSDRLRTLREEMDDGRPSTPPGGGTPPTDLPMAFWEAFAVARGFPASLLADLVRQGKRLQRMVKSLAKTASSLRSPGLLR